MNPTVVNKLLLSRSMYQLAKEHARSPSGVSLSIACNLLQDAVETFLLALIEYVGAPMGPNTKFHEYFDLINRRVAPYELPFQSHLIALNKLRINSKHAGLEPARNVLEPLVTTVWEFFEQVTHSRFGMAFSTISLIDLLPDNTAKALLRDAERAFHDGKHQDCLILCRQALYLTYESQYDARPFLKAGNGYSFGALFSNVPSYARNADYILRNVKQPTDFIVVDQDDLQLELLRDGVDPVAVSNIRRLTPEVYLYRGEDRWVVKHEFSVLDAEDIKDRAEYVLVTATDVLLTRHHARSRSRSRSSTGQYYIDLKREGVPVYAKASRQSEVLLVTQPGCGRLYVTYHTLGLDAPETYWYANLLEAGAIGGFVHEEDVDFGL